MIIKKYKSIRSFFHSLVIGLVIEGLPDLIGLDINRGFFKPLLFKLDQNLHKAFIRPYDLNKVSTVRLALTYSKEVRRLCFF